jgi:hypothetical protein
MIICPIETFVLIFLKVQYTHIYSLNDIYGTKDCTLTTLQESSFIVVHIVLHIGQVHVLFGNTYAHLYSLLMRTPLYLINALNIWHVVLPC